MNMRLFKDVNFFKAFTKYYKITIPDFCLTSFVARDSLTIHYYKPATDIANKLKVMTFNFSKIDHSSFYTDNPNMILLEVDIPLHHNLDGIVIDNLQIKEYIEKINLFMPFLKKNNPFWVVEEKSIKLSIIFSFDNTTSRNQQFTFKGMRLGNNIRYKNQYPFLEDLEEDFLLQSERNMDSFLEKMNIDYKNMNYKEKIAIFDMIVI